MKSLWIVGAGGLGREVFGYCAHHPDCKRGWQVAGFLDDNPAALEGRHYPGIELRPLTGHEPKPDELFIVALGMPAIRRKVAGDLGSRGAQFLSFIHPAAVVGYNVRLGNGCIVCPLVCLTSDIELGDFVLVNVHASVDHDVKVGAFTSVGPHCDLTGGVQVGEEVFLGSGARVIPGKRVGARSVVGAGSVVINDVPGDVTVFGVPARVVK